MKEMTSIDAWDLKRLQEQARAWECVFDALRDHNPEVYRTGGASHFVQMNNGSWEDMKDEMQCLSECDYAGVGKYLLHVADRRK